MKISDFQIKNHEKIFFSVGGLFFLIFAHVFGVSVAKPFSWPFLRAWWRFVPRGGKKPLPKYLWGLNGVKSPVFWVHAFSVFLGPFFGLPFGRVWPRRWNWGRAGTPGQLGRGFLRKWGGPFLAPRAQTAFCGAKKGRFLHPPLFRAGVGRATAPPRSGACCSWNRRPSSAARASPWKPAALCRPLCWPSLPWPCPCPRCGFWRPPCFRP